MSCENCNKLTQHGANYCNGCYNTLFCSLCNIHRDYVGPLRSRRGENCCSECMYKTKTLEELKEQKVEIESISVISENPHYLSDLINGWWFDGDKYYFAIQNQIYAADDLPMDIDEFKRAITFDTLDAEMCGVIRGTTVIWT